MFEYNACTEKGKKRDTNADRVCIDSCMLAQGSVAGRIEESLAAVVCDGADNCEGAAAAEIVAGGFRDISIAEQSALRVSHKLQTLNRRVGLKRISHSRESMTVSAVSGLLIWKKRYILFLSGDSRIYGFSENRLSLLAEDQILPAEGQNASKEICGPIIKRGVLNKDNYLFVICTHGIYENIGERELADILISQGSLEEKRSAILENSFQNGAEDDRSLVLIHYSPSVSSLSGNSPKE